MGTKLGAPSEGVIVSDSYAEGKTALGGRLLLIFKLPVFSSSRPPRPRPVRSDDKRLTSGRYPAANGPWGQLGVGWSCPNCVDGLALGFQVWLNAGSVERSRPTQRPCIGESLIGESEPGISNALVSTWPVAPRANPNNFCQPVGASCFITSRLRRHRPPGNLNRAIRENAVQVGGKQLVLRHLSDLIAGL